MTDDERAGRGQEAMGRMLTSPHLRPEGLMSLDARMPRDRGPDEGRHLRVMGGLAQRQSWLPESQDWDTSVEGQRVLAGMSREDQEYVLRNLAYARQGEMTPQERVAQELAQREYNTVLTPDEEQRFLLWKQQYAPRDSGRDYDYRGAFKAGMRPDATGHWKDTFKKPSHPTFSTDSQYAPYGKPGEWHGEVYTPYKQRRK